jgi:cell division transport system permease protein
MKREDKFKRNLITFSRIVKTGCINFVRNASLSLAAMAVMLITLTIILFSFIANATFSNTIQQITDKIDISVYLKDTVTVGQKDKLIKQLESNNNVKSVSYISKDQALKTYKQQNASNVDLLVAISETDNPLPATLNIKPKDPNKINDIKTILEKPDVKVLQSDVTSYSGDRKEAIDKIAHATSFFRKAGAAGVVVFALISVLIIFNTIRMAIFNRRDEIQIMRLLGASTSYIRGPFVVESVLYGVISAIISVVLLNGLFIASSSTLQASSLGLLDINYSYLYFSQHFWLFLTGQLSIGIFIGAASSVIATRRYLKFNISKK